MPFAVPRFGGQCQGSHRRATRAAHVARTAIRVGPPALLIGELRHWRRRPSSGGLPGAGAHSFALRELRRPLRPDTPGPSRCASWAWQVSGQSADRIPLIRRLESGGAVQQGRLSTRTLCGQSVGPRHKILPRTCELPRNVLRRVHSAPPLPLAPSPPMPSRRPLRSLTRF